MVITNTKHFIAEDLLWAFLKATQSDTLKKLKDDYGTDARDEVFRALRKELDHTPLWMILRHGLKVRGLEFHLYYPKPRSDESAAVKKYGENRITFRLHFYFGEANQEIDFVLFLNGLPIVTLEVKHEKNQNVHDAVAQFASPRPQIFNIISLPRCDTSDVLDYRRPMPGGASVAQRRLTDPTDARLIPVGSLYLRSCRKTICLSALVLLIRLPKREAEEDSGRQASVLPRYHKAAWCGR
jgi:type I restriction enzyme R subunit